MTNQKRKLNYQKSCIQWLGTLFRLAPQNEILISCIWGISPVLSTINYRWLKTFVFYHISVELCHFVKAFSWNPQNIPEKVLCCVQKRIYFNACFEEFRISNRRACSSFFSLKIRGERFVWRQKGSRRKVIKLDLFPPQNNCCFEGGFVSCVMIRN